MSASRDYGANGCRGWRLAALLCRWFGRWIVVTRKGDSGLLRNDGIGGLAGGEPLWAS